MIALEACLGIDSLCVALAVVCVRRYGSAWHPLTIYVFYHLVTVTWRAWSIAFGASTLYSGYSQFEEVTWQEIVRAIICCDVSLFSITAGAFVAARRKSHAGSQFWGRDLRRFGIRDVRAVVVLLLPFGLMALFATRLGAVDALTRGYLSMIAFWPINIVCLLVFIYGFRPVLVALAVPYIVTVGLQGYHRFMVLLPVMFLMALALMRSGRRWPSFVGVLVCAVVVVTFPSWKSAGRGFQEQGLSGVIDVLSREVDEAFSDWRTDSDLLDQIAAGMTLQDRKGGYYGGLTYTYVITLPVPRAMWQEKPGLVQHIVDFSTDRRPMGREGRVIGITGESYVNFGYPGVAIIPFLFGFVSVAFYGRAMSQNQGSLSRYLYLVFMTTLIQVYRDGVGALLLFGLFKNSQVIAVLVLARLRYAYERS